MKQRLGLGALLGAGHAVDGPGSVFGPERDRRLADRRLRRRAPGVSASKLQPRDDRRRREPTVTDSQGRYRFEAMRPGTYKLDLLAHRLRHRGARRRQPAVELHRDGERRDEGRLARRNDQRVRHGSAGRRAAGIAHDGHCPRRHRLAADLAQRHGPRRPRGGRASRAHPDVGGIANDRAGGPARARPRRIRRRAAGRRHVGTELRGRIPELHRRHPAVRNDRDDIRRFRRTRAAAASV